MTQNLNFNNFLSKHNVSTKLLLIVQLTNGNPIQFTELVYIAYTEGEIIEVMYRGVFCVHKHGFLMLGHKWNPYSRIDVANELACCILNASLPYLFGVFHS